MFSFPAFWFLGQQVPGRELKHPNGKHSNLCEMPWTWTKGKDNLIDTLRVFTSIRGYSNMYQWLKCFIFPAKLLWSCARAEMFCHEGIACGQTAAAAAAGQCWRTPPPLCADLWSREASGAHRILLPWCPLVTDTLHGFLKHRVLKSQTREKKRGSIKFVH